MSYDAPVDPSGCDCAYRSPYGQWSGLIERLGGWAQRMSTDRTLPWAGTGIIKDIELAMRFLNAREFLEHLRVHGPDDQRAFAADAIEALDTTEAAESAVYNADFNLGKAARAATAENEEVRELLVSLGALADDDTETAIPDLLRALLS